MARPFGRTNVLVFNEYALRAELPVSALKRWRTGDGATPGAASGCPCGAVPAGAVIISEFRWAGPAGNEDEFIELYTTRLPITVNDVNPPATGPRGWAIVSSDTPLVAKAVVPTGVTIPARGHYLIANNTVTTGYSRVHITRQTMVGRHHGHTRPHLHNRHSKQRGHRALPLGQLDELHAGGSA